MKSFGGGEELKEEEDKGWRTRVTGGRKQGDRPWHGEVQPRGAAVGKDLPGCARRVTRRSRR